jgi:hypothetical protein
LANQEAIASGQVGTFLSAKIETFLKLFGFHAIGFGRSRIAKAI